MSLLLADQHLFHCQGKVAQFPNFSNLDWTSDCPSSMTEIQSGKPFSICFHSYDTWERREEVGAVSTLICCSVRLGVSSELDLATPLPLGRLTSNFDHSQTFASESHPSSQ